ncbi:long-chain-fatty-acid--CoA ligase [Solimonas sp. K1W22B-7]|uniref:long-chain-fatty-acid--CoA ligase n=1 Tax=Solimonas sp. K1W22B-7 TaxID=2303331 RepID=UPI000E33413D|nr:long-chain-fatty-acid--CoA ligase [Solimonas sp. K1W22B-7]AXQ31088.1 long-chain-fatty-acid--CoA ligase [Solimonas sp. K1W22B-7]
MQFTQGLHRALQQRPDTIATICGERKTSFRQLQDRVARLAGALRKLGVRDGDRVAMLGFNSDHYLAYYLAVPWAGAVVNPVNFRWSLDEIIYSLNDSESVAIFLDDSFAKHADALLDGCPFLRFVIFCGDGQCPDDLLDLETLIAGAEPIADSGVGDDETFGVFYTGGTTGAPKGVLLSHRNISSAALALMAEGPFPDGSIGLHAAPMFHLADMMMSTCLLLRGGTHVMLPGFRPDIALDIISKHRISELLLVPAMLQALVDYPDIGRHDLSAVKHLLYGASPASEALLDRAMKAIPGAGFFQVYGMTELAATATTLPPSQHGVEGRIAGRLRSAGRAFCHLQVRVVDTEDVELPRGQVGEIVVRGPNVMQGYLNKPEATEAALRGGWMHTGDMGYMDDEGYVFVVDRLKDMIISGGENVYCAEVENAVARHPAVAACAVIGIPSEEWGEAVHATVVLHNGGELSQEALYAHCKQLIAGYKCPRSMEVRDSLPISGAGKVLKTELRKPFWEGRERAVN